MSSLVRNLTSVMDEVNPSYQPTVKAAGIISGLSLVGAVFTTSEAVKIFALTLFTAMGSGIVNNILACPDCPRYFTNGPREVAVGKVAWPQPPLKTLNPKFNAIAHGMIGAFTISVLVAPIFIFLARVPVSGVAIKVAAAQLVPYYITTAVLALATAHVISRMAQKALQDQPSIKYRGVAMELQAGLDACYVRKATGRTVMAAGSAVLSIAIIAARAGIIKL